MPRSLALLALLSALLLGALGWWLLGGRSPVRNTISSIEAAPAEPDRGPGPPATDARAGGAVSRTTTPDPSGATAPGGEDGSAVPWPLLGTVLGSDHRALAGALVEAVPLLACPSQHPELDVILHVHQLPARAARSTTDARGRFLLSVPEAGTYVIQAAHPDHGAAIATATPSPVSNHTLTLGAAADLRGVVVSSGRSTRSSRSVVLLEPLTGSTPGFCIREQAVNDSGAFRFVGLTPGRYSLLLPLDEAGGIVRSARLPGEPVELRDERDLVVRFEVREARTGAAIEEARIAVVGRSFFARGTTAAEGAVDLPVAREVMQVLVQAPGFPASEQQCAVPVDGEPILLEVGAPATLTGTVLDPDGGPLPGVEVAWIGAEGPVATTLSDGVGGYRVEVPASNPGVLAVRATGLAVTLPSRSRTPTTREDILRLVPTFDQLGRVEDLAGDPVGQVRLDFGDAGRDPAVDAALAWMSDGSLQVQAGPDGQFIVHDLAPRPRHVIVVDHPGFAPHAEETALRSGALLRIQLRPLCEVTGTVFGPDGAVAPQAEVVLEWPEGPPLDRTRGERRWRGLRTLTDDHGGFRFPAAPSGAVSLLAEAAPYPEAIQRLTLVPAERRAVEVRLPLGQEVAVRVESARGVPLAGVDVRLAGASRDGSKEDRPAKTDAGGEYRFAHLKPGRYVVFSGRAKDTVQVGAADDGPPAPVTLRRADD